MKNDVVKIDVYNAKIWDIEDKTHDITNLAPNTTLNAKTNKVKNAILTIAYFVEKTDFDDKLNDVNKKIASNKTKHVLVENELNEL